MKQLRLPFVHPLKKGDVLAIKNKIVKVIHIQKDENGFVILTSHLKKEDA